MPEYPTPRPDEALPETPVWPSNAATKHDVFRARTGNENAEAYAAAWSLSDSRLPIVEFATVSWVHGYTEPSSKRSHQEEAIKWVRIPYAPAAAITFDMLFTPWRGDWPMFPAMINALHQMGIDMVQLGLRFLDPQVHCKPQAAKGRG